MKVTIVDVAKKADVSVATVSRVMNNNYPVKAKTRVRVQKAINDLQFIPNMQAQEIKKKKSKTIGIIVPSVDNMFFPEVINGVEDALMQNGYSLLLSFSKNKKEKEQDCVKNLLSRKVAGIIIADAHTDNVETKFYNEFTKDTPIVFINGDSSHQEFSYVLCDEVDGANKAMGALWNHGHQDIYFIRGENSFSYDVKEKAYREFLKQQGVEDKAKIIYVGEGNSGKVIDQTSEIIRERLKLKECTAAFCCNDLMAIGVMNACKEEGIRIPQDFSIIGFDNIILSRLVQPKLTTVDQNMYQLGLHAAQLVLENIKMENEINKKVILNTTLIERETLAVRKE